MYFFGYKYHKKFFRSKEISLFRFSESNKQIHLDKGKYSIALLGGGTISNFSISIFSEVKNKNVSIFESLLKYRFHKNGMLGTNYYEFNIDESGEYLVQVGDGKNISVKSSMLKSVSLFQREMPIGRLSILIKGYSSPLHFIFALLLFILGSMLLMLNVAYLLYKLGIVKLS